MASIFSGTEPPEWLREIAKPIGPETGQLFGTLLAGLSDAYSTAKEKNAVADKTGGKQTSFWEEIPQGFHDAAMDLKDPLWRLKVQEGQLGLAQKKIQMDAQQNALTTKIAQTADIDADQKSIADWVQKYPTLEDRIDAPPPTLKSDFGYKAWEGIRTKDSQSALFKGQKAFADNWKVSVGKLWGVNPKLASKLAGMKPNADGSPTPEMLSIMDEGMSGSLPTKAQSPLGKLQADRDAAIARFGQDSDQVKQYDQAIQEQVTNKGKSIYMGQDDQGRPIFQMTEGGAAPLKPTVATQTMAQEKLLQYENATQLLNNLEHNLKPEHVGARGALGEIAVDKTLEQIVPGVANKGRIQARSAIVALRSTLLRQISDDRSGRFSTADREDIADALPSSGVFESYADAKQKLSTVRKILADRAGVYSGAMKQQKPAWAMSPEEIRQAFKDGKMTEQEATDALVKFH